MRDLDRTGQNKLLANIGIEPATVLIGRVGGNLAAPHGQYAIGQIKGATVADRTVFADMAAINGDGTSLSTNEELKVNAMCVKLRGESVQHFFLGRDKIRCGSCHRTS